MLCLYSPPRKWGEALPHCPSHRSVCVEIRQELIPNVSCGILKVLPRAFLQHHALAGSSAEKVGEKNSKVGSYLLCTFASSCYFIRLRRKKAAGMKTRGGEMT